MSDSALVILPRPDKTTYVMMLLADSTDETIRKAALEDAMAGALTGWKPGNDLAVIIRAPTDFERTSMLAYDR